MPDRRHFTKTSAFLRDLAGGRADGSWEPRLRRYLQSDVLILDDFGMREFTPSQAEDLYELICQRFRVGSLLVTSNRAPKDWYPLFPNPVLAESALDRLVNSAHHVILRGRSYRPFRRPDGGGYPAVNDPDDTPAGQPGRALQARPAETPPEASDDLDQMSDTPLPEAATRPHRRAANPLPS